MATATKLPSRAGDRTALADRIPHLPGATASRPETGFLRRDAQTTATPRRTLRLRALSETCLCRPTTKVSRHGQGGEKRETFNRRSDLAGQNARLVRVGLTDLLGGCWWRETRRCNETIAVLILNLLEVRDQLGRIVVAHDGDAVSDFANLIDDGIRHCWIHDRLRVILRA